MAICFFKLQNPEASAAANKLDLFKKEFYTVCSSAHRATFQPFFAAWDAGDSWKYLCRVKLNCYQVEVTVEDEEVVAE